jgi:ABC-2 type transport system permease protein
MIGSFIKKQFLLFMRNPHELLILLGMPFVLITILGFALGNVMDGDTPKIHAKIAFVDHGDEQADVQKFVHELESMKLPDNQKKMMVNAAKNTLLVTMFQKDVLGSKDLKPYIKVVTVQPSDLQNIRKDDSYTAIIEVPKQFTYLLLKHVLLGEKQAPRISFYVNQGKEITSQFIEDVVVGFQQRYSTFSVLGKSGLINGSFEMPRIDVQGKVETVTKKEPIHAVTYYMVGMSVMFALYIASHVGSYAFNEKQLHVFDRILLADVSKWSYMMGIFLSAVLLTFLQLNILYGITSFMYHIRWFDLVSFVFVTLAFSLAVGGLAVLLTALNFRVNSEQVSRFFQTTVVTLFSLLGGSFFPSSQLSDLINTLGNLTPNGSAMSAYLKLLQGYELTEVTHSIVYLCMFSLVMAVAAVWVFPKRGNLA